RCRMLSSSTSSTTVSVMARAPAEDRSRRARSHRRDRAACWRRPLVILLALLDRPALPDLPIDLGVTLRQHLRVVQVLLVLTHEVVHGYQSSTFASALMSDRFRR